MKRGKKRMKQAHTGSPMSGKKVTMGHGMGGLFGVTPKKPEADMPPRTRSAQARSKQARMKRLDGRLI